MATKLTTNLPTDIINTFGSGKRIIRPNSKIGILLNKNDGSTAICLVLKIFKTSDATKCILLVNNLMTNKKNEYYELTLNDILVFV